MGAVVAVGFLLREGFLRLVGVVFAAGDGADDHLFAVFAEIGAQFPHKGQAVAHHVGLAGVIPGHPLGVQEFGLGGDDHGQVFQIAGVDIAAVQPL